MFGNNTMNRFIVMCTFSDGKQPLAEDAIKKAKFEIEKFQKFNNSHIFNRCKDDLIDKTTLEFFKLGYSNF